MLFRKSGLYKWWINALGMVPQQGFRFFNKLHPGSKAPQRSKGKFRVFSARAARTDFRKIDCQIRDCLTRTHFFLQLTNEKSNWSWNVKGISVCDMHLKGNFQKWCCLVSTPSCHEAATPSVSLKTHYVAVSAIPLVQLLHNMSV